jgi:hypothetical protein
MFRTQLVDMGYRNPKQWIGGIDPLMSNLHFSLRCGFHWICLAFSINPNRDEQN